MSVAPQGGCEGRAAELTALLANETPEPTDHEHVRKFIHQLAETGLSVLFIYPGSKEPADMRTAAKRNADDKAAREAAKADGRRDWAKTKSPSGLALATADTDVLDGYLDRYIEVFAAKYPDGVPVNLAAETGGSGLVVVDCDTAAQMQRWFEVSGIDAASAPTVLTPGQLGTDGTMVHADGGHFWFVVPEDVELPTNVGAMTWPGDDGFAVLWHRRYALIPPSVRPEGPYAVAGEVHELPDWLANEIVRAGERRAQRSRGGAAQPADGDLAERIDTWAETVSWASILEPLGWYPVTRPDGCGCEVWTAPGAHASPKSATAHDSGCTAGIYAEVNAPLHFWTDHDRAPFDAWLNERPGNATISKLQAVAVAYYDNNEAAAMTDLGLTSRPRSVKPEDFGWEASDDGATGHQAETGGKPTIENDPIDPALTGAVFSHSEVTEFLMARAELRMVSPWALLGNALLQAAAMVPWWMRLPPSIGIDGSANLLAVFAGMTGTGKGGAADPGIDWDAGWDPMSADPVDEMRPSAPAVDLLYEHKTGSGQAFAALFMGMVPDIHPITGKPREVVAQTKRVNVVGFAEIDDYTALATQQSSTVFSVTRQLFDGKGLGEFTKDRKLRTELPPFGWRIVMSIHGQPERCGDLMAQDDGGTPQRFMWIHPDWPLEQCDLEDEPEPPTAEELGVTYPVGRLAWPGGPNQVAYIKIDKEIGRILRNTRRRRTNIRSEHATVEDRQGSHRGLLQLKVAVAVAVLHGRTDVQMSDWRLAGLILEHSDRTVALVRRVLDAQRVGVFINRGKGDEIRESGKISARIAAVDKVGQRIIDWLSKRAAGTTVTEASVIREVLGTRESGYAAAALAALVDDGKLAEAGENRKKKMTYRLPEAADADDPA